MPKAKSAALEAAAWFEVRGRTEGLEDISARLRREDRERVRMERAIIKWVAEEGLWGAAGQHFERLVRRIERRMARK